MAAKTIKWACPKCGADANEHGKGGADKCLENPYHHDCQGFLCECDGDAADGHGESHEDPCLEANCYHCGWGGTFPVKPKALAGWRKTAWAAGWRPMAGKS